MPEKIFTTHEIAGFCGVYPSSVVNWINSGKLKSFQTAGGHHRVKRESLLEFMRQLSIPIPASVAGRASVLIVDDDKEVAGAVERAFQRHSEQFDTAVCADGVDALIRIGQTPPMLVILDMVMPKLDGLQVCKILKTKPETRKIKIIAVSGKKFPGTDKKLESLGVEAFFRKPLEIQELVLKAMELLAKDGLTPPLRR